MTNKYKFTEADIAFINQCLEEYTKEILPFTEFLVKAQNSFPPRMIFDPNSGSIERIDHPEYKKIEEQTYACVDSIAKTIEQKIKTRFPEVIWRE